MKALQSGRVWHDVIKEAPVKLDVVVALARDSQGAWENFRGKRHKKGVGR